ncbi:hypothetical protein [Ottowia sp.]|uniref:hypothetical protein n=1 Tax=Ottowia sp. TaxID=1898956 RepID=UPI003A840E3D
MTVRHSHFAFLALLASLSLGSQAADAPAAPASTSATAAQAPVAAAATPAAPKTASKRQAAAAKPVTAQSGVPLDVSHLVEKDMAMEVQTGPRKGHVVNKDGVNCSLYPARCR